MPPWGGVLGISHQEGAPGRIQEALSLGWPGNALGPCQKSWRQCIGRGKPGFLFSDCCPHDLVTHKDMDGWMDVFLKDKKKRGVTTDVTKSCARLTSGGRGS